MHDGNRESANSLGKNINFEYWTYMENKYFNKKMKEDEIINY